MIVLIFVILASLFLIYISIRNELVSKELKLWLDVLYLYNLDCINNVNQKINKMLDNNELHPNSIGFVYNRELKEILLDYEGLPKFDDILFKMDIFSSIRKNLIRDYEIIDKLSQWANERYRKDGV